MHLSSVSFQGLLEPLIQDLMDTATTESTATTFEVDPMRIEPSENLEQNRRNLINITQNVFDAIISSADRFPSQLR